MHADSLDPQAKRAVDRQDRIPFPHSRRALPVFRLLERIFTRLENRSLPSVGRTVDRTIPGPAGDIDARLFLPEGSGRFPTVVFFHGGGYVFGSIDSHAWLCRHLVRESGCAVLSVDYRLAPEHPFPAAVEDAFAAVEWAAANADSIAGTGTIAVAGDSAGGTLAAVTALMAAEQDGPDIAYQALLYPAIGAKPDHPSMEHAGIILSEADLRWFRECYYDSEIHERNPYGDPSNAVDLSGLAPATVLTAGFDPLRDGARAYAERLVRDGVQTRYVNYEAMPHGFLTFREVDRTREAIADIGDDLADAIVDKPRH